VDAFAEAYWRAGEKGLGQKQLQAKLSPVLQRFGDMVAEAKQHESSSELERLRLVIKNMESFCSLYDFLSQIIAFGDPELEKRYIFFRHVLHPLRETLRTETPEDGGVDLSAIRLTHYKIHRRRNEDGLRFDPEGESLLETPAVAQGTGAPRDRKKALLSEIVEQMNEIFEGELSDADVISYAEGVRDKLMEDREVALQARNNASLDQFANGKIKQAIPKAIWEMRSAHQSMTDQVMADTETMNRFAEVITRMVYEVANESTG
jgi:type I restriction enzyme R subunit